MSDLCFDGLSRRFCAFKGCGKRLSRGSKSGFCQHHTKGRGVYESRAWTVVRFDLLKEWEGAEK